MVKSHVQVVIERPPAVVWQFLMSPSHYPLWQAGVIAVAASQGLQTGSLLKITVKSPVGQLSMKAQVVTNDGGSYYEVHSTRGSIDFKVSLRLIPHQTGTRVEMTSIITAYAVLKLAEAALQAESDRQNQADLRRLKHLLEQ